MIQNTGEATSFNHEQIPYNNIEMVAVVTAISDLVYPSSDNSRNYLEEAKLNGDEVYEWLGETLRNQVADATAQRGVPRNDETDTISSTTLGKLVAGTSQQTIDVNRLSEELKTSADTIAEYIKNGTKVPDDTINDYNEKLQKVRAMQLGVLFSTQFISAMLSPTGLINLKTTPDYERLEIMQPSMASGEPPSPKDIEEARKGAANNTGNWNNNGTSTATAVALGSAVVSMLIQPTNIAAIGDIAKTLFGENTIVSIQEGTSEDGKIHPEQQEFGCQAVITLDGYNRLFLTFPDQKTIIPKEYLALITNESYYNHKLLDFNMQKDIPDRDGTMHPNEYNEHQYLYFLNLVHFGNPIEVRLPLGTYYEDFVRMAEEEAGHVPAFTVPEETFAEIYGYGIPDGATAVIVPAEPYDNRVMPRFAFPVKRCEHPIIPDGQTNPWTGPQQVDTTEADRQRDLEINAWTAVLNKVLTPMVELQENEFSDGTPWDHIPTKTGEIDVYGIQLPSHVLGLIENNLFSIPGDIETASQYKRHVEKLFGSNTIAVNYENPGEISGARIPAQEVQFFGEITIGGTKFGIISMKEHSGQKSIQLTPLDQLNIEGTTIGKMITDDPIRNFVEAVPDISKDPVFGTLVPFSILTEEGIIVTYDENDWANGDVYVKINPYLVKTVAYDSGDKWLNKTWQKITNGISKNTPVNVNFAVNRLNHETGEYETTSYTVKGFIPNSLWEGMNKNFPDPEIAKGIFFSKADWRELLRP